MKVNKRIEEYRFAPLRYWDWDFTDGIRDDVTISYGMVMDEKPKSEGKHIFIDLELPNSFITSAIHRVHQREKSFDKILTISPHSVESRNNALSTDKYVNVYYPVINEKYIPINFDKKYDIFYTGNILPRAKLFKKLVIPILLNTNHVCVGGGSGPGSMLPELNNQPVDFFEKYNLNAMCRISVSYDIQPNPSRINQMKESGVSFKYTDWGEPYFVQYKARTFEPFFCKSLVLHYKDDFRILEEFCTPDKHFIYFDDVNDFKEKSKYILENYHEFEPMIEETFKYAVENFTVESFFEKYLRRI